MPKAIKANSTPPPKTFGEAINRSLAAMPPGALVTDWLSDSAEGRLVSAAKAMGDNSLLAWLMAAPLGGAAK